MAIEDAVRLQAAPVIRGAWAQRVEAAMDGVQRVILEHRPAAAAERDDVALPEYSPDNQEAFAAACRDSLSGSDTRSVFVPRVGRLAIAALDSAVAQKPLAGQVAVITGAASGIGAATALAFAQEGACLILADLNEEGLAAVAAECGKHKILCERVLCNMTLPIDVDRVVEAAILRFGGVDILVSNAGKIWQGKMADVSDTDLRASFELNFFSHQAIAAAVTRVLLRQKTGGQLLFNASKSAFNPGPAMGPYTLPKAAVIALMKQYAIEYGDYGIRCNAVNADRVPTNIFGAGVLEQRASARQLSVEEYLSGNLLKRVVYPHDVAKAFLLLAHSEKTTGTVLPVDGGNIAAAPR